MSEKKKVFGIDLGTTYSCIAHVDETDRAVVLKNSEGSDTTPSVVCYESSDSVQVGDVAKENAVIEPERTASLFKPLMGKSPTALVLDGEDKSPQEVSSHVLRKLAKDTSDLIDIEVKDVVITVPAYFGQNERDATKAAGKMAGLNVLEVLDEPVAAAIAYGLDRGNDNTTILVYDLGGGTFDVSVMRVGDGGDLDVICTTGDHALGGKNWDDEIIKYAIKEFASATSFEGDLDDNEMQDLRIKAEKAKKMLTGKKPDTNIIVSAGGTTKSIALEKAKFNDITSHLLEATLKLTDEAIDIAKGKGHTIDEVILVGGSTRMNQVEDALTKKYSLPLKKTDVDLCVAQGAALYAAGRGDGKGKKKLKLAGEEITITMATRKSLAIECIIDDVAKCKNMIIAHSRMPDGKVSVTEEFLTYSANMTKAPLVVYESDITDEIFDIDKKYLLGTVVLELTGDLPEGAPLAVTFTLNNDGTLEVSGLDLTKNKSIKAPLQAQKGYSMTDAEVEEMTKKLEGITIKS